MMVHRIATMAARPTPPRLLLEFVDAGNPMSIRTRMVHRIVLMNALRMVARPWLAHVAVEFLKRIWTVTALKIARMVAQLIRTKSVQENAVAVFQTLIQTVMVPPIVWTHAALILPRQRLVFAAVELRMLIRMLMVSPIATINARTIKERLPQDSVDVVTLTPIRIQMVLLTATTSVPQTPRRLNPASADAAWLMRTLIKTEHAITMIPALLIRRRMPWVSVDVV
jgi:hypothetical protein